MAKRDLSSSSVFNSLKAAGNIFNDTAKKMMAKRPTQSDNFLSLAPNDVIIFPLYLRYGYNKVYGSFVLGYVLKGGKPASAEIHQIFPSTIKRTLWPVEKDEETGEWQRVRDVNPTNTGTAVEFANKFGIPMVQVVESSSNETKCNLHEAAFTDVETGILINSGFLTGLLAFLDVDGATANIVSILHCAPFPLFLLILATAD